MDYRITDAIAKYDMLSFHDDIDKRSGRNKWCLVEFKIGRSVIVGAWEVLGRGDMIYVGPILRVC